MKIYLSLALKMLREFIRRAKAIHRYNELKRIADRLAHFHAHKVIGDDFNPEMNGVMFLPVFSLQREVENARSRFMERVITG